MAGEVLGPSTAIKQEEPKGSVPAHTWYRATK